MIDLTELAVTSTMCPRCEARPGQRCVTISGALAAIDHAARTKPIYAAWRDGYSDGGTDAVDTVRRIAERHNLIESEGALDKLLTDTARSYAPR